MILVSLNCQGTIYSDQDIVAFTGIVSRGHRERRFDSSLTCLSVLFTFAHRIAFANSNREQEKGVKSRWVSSVKWEANIREDNWQTYRHLCCKKISLLVIFYSISSTHHQRLIHTFNRLFIYFIRRLFSAFQPSESSRLIGRVNKLHHGAVQLDFNACH